MRLSFMCAGVLLLALAALARADGLLPLPDAATQTKSLNQFKEVLRNRYGEKPSAASKREFARDLIDRWHGNAEEAANRYMALKMASDLAAETGDTRTTERAIDLLASLYAIPVGDVKLRAFTTIRQSTENHDELDRMANLALKGTGDAVLIDAYDTAGRLVELAGSVGKKHNDNALIKQAQEREAEIEAIVAERERLKPTMKSLEKSPDDPAANLAVGRFIAVMKCDWKRGAEMLAKGSDAALKAVAEKELALNPEEKDGLKELELGDAWWNLVPKQTPVYKPFVQRRAIKWYRDAVPHLRTATDKALLEDSFDHAIKLSSLAEEAATKTGDADLIARAHARSAEMLAVREESTRARAAMKVLEQKSDDPAASLLVGKFYCFMKGDWEKGIPLLLKATDAGLKAAAEKEQTNPADTPGRVSVGDAWWSLAERNQGGLKAAMQRRAAKWYKSALPELKGMDREQITSRINAVPPAP